MLAFDLAEKSKKDAVIKYIKLLGLKDPENVVQESNGIFSHTNTRGKKRILIPCIRFSEYKRREKEYQKTKVQKCLGYYVLEVIQ
jgi:hypothetical protein